MFELPKIPGCMSVHNCSDWLKLSTLIQHPKTTGETMTKTRHHIYRVYALLIATIATCHTLAEPAVTTSSTGAKHGIFEMSIEDLMQVDVSLVSRKGEALFTAPSAVYVISQEDIERSGATSIPELLRMVPGLQVTRMDANKWAVTARGFNGRFARHMLVLVDGRSVYTPLFSGVFWEVQDMLLQDVERIEVIRGPGGTMWGANAVNGVINIITKNAAQTQGQLITAAAGTEDRWIAGYRYGGELGENLFGRLYLKGFDRDSSAGEEEMHDDWRMGRGGFRLDWHPTSDNQFTLQGDYYEGTAGQMIMGPDPLAWPFPMEQKTIEDVQLQGGNLLGRWEHSSAPQSSLSLQIYYDKTIRDEQMIHEDRDIIDIDFQHRFPVGEAHDLLWGAGYRYSRDELRGGATLSITDEDRTDHLFSAFLQDELTVVPERMKLTLGTKVEYNDYTGMEVQPSLRLVLTPWTRHVFWAAASRAVRTPSRLEHTVELRRIFPGGIPVLIQGNEDVDSEILTAYELGYRFQPSDKLSLDTTLFYHDYDRLQSLSPGVPALPLPITVVNDAYGAAYGAEATARWQVKSWWRLVASYGFMRLHLHIDDDAFDPFTEALFERDYPRNQVSLRSMMDLGRGVQFDTWLRYVDNISTAEHAIGSRLEMDVRLAWQATPDLLLEVVGQNLFDPRHPEYGSSVAFRTQEAEVERAVYGRLTYRF